ncbi:unnamed protein product [Rangifer tarandus platyrhynchus]|uniref:Uncharacterized protein n=1 Tax=Rangifer tarandus platyrhynchus TaxID=3082113 RepID=A0AC59ZL31_RANTA
MRLRCCSSREIQKVTRFLTSGWSDRRGLRATVGVGESQAARPPRASTRISSRSGKSRAKARAGAGAGRARGAGAGPDDYGACRGPEKLWARRAGPSSGVGGDNWLGSERRSEAAWREERAFSRGGTGPGAPEPSVCTPWLPAGT